MEVNELRSKFLEFFKAKGHAIIPSSSLVPVNDPTLLFTNAGMNQFKDIFLGVGVEIKSYNQAASVQRCMRAGGKHNDLENVGFTPRHHTFFEMLGNFSFGAYFKEEAIQYAWEFLTEELQIPAQKLSVTVYKDDKEAADIWLKKIKLDPTKLKACGKKDNFWAMGDTGPCGPCSEIFYDHGPQLPKEDRYVEIWNLVFMQYNCLSSGELQPLPNPSIDTGMGLERLAAAMQGVYDNYHIDIFRRIISGISDILKVKNDGNTSLRVIADHIRAITFLIADGIIPGNEGRAYVLRRIIRRAYRHGHKLGVNDPFLYKLVVLVVKEMVAAYPMLADAQTTIEQIVLQEEQQFALTLEHGLKIFDEMVHAKGAKKIISGDMVFKLYDTYGFPVDLTEVLAKEQGFKVDHKGFDKCMATQRKTSKQSSQFKVDYAKILETAQHTEFVGYETNKIASKVVLLIKAGNQVKELATGEEGIIVLTKTPFYAEAGGQVGDTGEIGNKNGVFVVTNTQKHGNSYLHYGKILRGKLKTNDQIDAKVDQNNRQAISANHTATHLLHGALRQILGKHVEQKGSMVDSRRLRFDFSHFAALTEDEITRVESLVNQQIRANLPVATTLMDLAEAKKRGVVALFEEKYAQKVRVVAAGDFSQELCGGTHLKATGEIGLFKITIETGIAAGIRRIEAVTGEIALQYMTNLAKQLQQIAYALKTDSFNVLTKFQELLAHEKAQVKELQQLKARFAGNVVTELIQEAMPISDIKLIVKQLNLDIATLRSMIDQLKSSAKTVAVLVNVAENKVNLVVGVTKDCILQLHAGELAQFVAQQIGGKGGGRPDMGQGGGTDLSHLTKALDSVKEWIKKKL